MLCLACLYLLCVLVFRAENIHYIIGTYLFITATNQSVFDFQDQKLVQFLNQYFKMNGELYYLWSCLPFFFSLLFIVKSKTTFIFASAMHLIHFAVWLMYFQRNQSEKCSASHWL